MTIALKKGRMCHLFVHSPEFLFTDPIINERCETFLLLAGKLLNRRRRA